MPTITLIDDDMDELEQMLAHARRSIEEWDSFVSDPEIIARVKMK